MPDLHPTFLATDGKPAFVVLPYAEYEAMRTALADAAWDAAFEATTPESVMRIDGRIDELRYANMPLFNEQGEVTAPVLA